MRGDQLIPSHYKNLVVRFMNHNGALFNLDNLYLTFKIVFHYDHLVSIKLFRGWKVEKKSKQKIWRRHYPTYWPIIFRTFQINISQVQTISVQELYCKDLNLSTYKRRSITENKLLKFFRNFALNIFQFFEDFEKFWTALFLVQKRPKQSRMNMKKLLFPTIRKFNFLFLKKLKYLIWKWMVQLIFLYFSYLNLNLSIVSLNGPVIRILWLV